MVKNQLVPAGFSYATLADQATLAFAREDPQAWLARLPHPAVIDEAQLLPTLPLLIKELVDASGTTENQFVLTGSASIGRQGLGGADPLARRSVRLTMWPLTPWELEGHPGALSDALTDMVPVARTYPSEKPDDLLDRLRHGGWPSYVLPAPLPVARLRERISADILSILATGVDPQISLNPSVAVETLDALLRTPSDIFNASRLSQLLGFDRRTIDRYLGLFHRLFLVHWLPNCAASPARQSHSRAKVHPFDTSLSAESLERSGVNIPDQREVLGHLLESYVVNQIVASTGWAQRAATASFWRDAANKNTEVDLVLDTWGGRRVGVEVKAATTVAPHDLKGLLSLRSAKGLDKGYVVYTGTTVQQVADQIWTLPLGALATPAAFS